MEIHGFQKLTLLDYPHHIAATLFTGGCNFRCPFCHNAALAVNPKSVPVIPEAYVFDTLKKRRHMLEGVCITGGEPTLSPDLPDLVRSIKSLGLKVKLDTNGYHTSMLRNLMEEGLLDYIAMDIKNSPAKYPVTAGIPGLATGRITESAALIMASGIPYEFRTTVVKELHSPLDFTAIGQWLQGASSYYLQSYQDSDDILSPGLHAYDKKELRYFQELLTPYIASVFIRGID